MQIACIDKMISSSIPEAGEGAVSPFIDVALDLTLPALMSLAVDLLTKSLRPLAADCEFNVDTISPWTSTWSTSTSASVSATSSSASIAFSFPFRDGVELLFVGVDSDEPVDRRVGVYEPLRSGISSFDRS